MIDINVDLLQCFINFLIKRTSGSGIKNENISNTELTEELYKPIIRNLEKYTQLLLTIYQVQI